LTVKNTGLQNWVNVEAASCGDDTTLHRDPIHAGHSGAGPVHSAWRGCQHVGHIGTAQNDCWCS